MPSPRLLLLLAACFIFEAEAFKILVYNSQYGHSHSNFMGRIADELAEAGHNVTSFVPVINPATKVGTYKTKIINIPTSKKAQETAHKIHGSGGNEKNAVFYKSTFMSPFAAFIAGPMMQGMFVQQCEETLTHTDVLNALRDEHFDVYITESFDMCGLGLSHLIKPKSTIWMSASTLFGVQYDEAGVPMLPSFNPSPYTTHLNPHSIVSRFWNLIGEFLFRQFFAVGRSDMDKLFQKIHGSEYPTLRELSSRAAYVFTNAEPLMDYAHPTLHRVVDIGGIGAKPAAPLDKYWEEIMTRRKKTVLFSFGSVAPAIHIPEPAKHAIVKTMARFPDVTFIWKYEDPEDEFSKTYTSKLKNVVLSKWTPQSDLLNHPRMSAFVSHGGMGSCQETSRRGVPGLFIPLFGDQPRNAGIMEKNELGLVYDKFDLADDVKLAAALREVIENKKYRQNSQKLRAMLEKKPFSSRETLIKYVEFAAEFGPSEALRPQSFDMFLIEYYNLDLIVVFALISLFFAFITVKISCACFSRFFRTKEVKQKTS